MPPRIGSHFNTEKVVQIAKVFNWKGLKELLKQDPMSLGRRTANHYVVHIYQHVDCKSSRVINEQRCVSSRGLKTKLTKPVTKARVPHSRGLLDTVDTLLTTCRHDVVEMDPENQRLLHISTFIQKTMKKGITNIDLMNIPTTGNCKRKNQAHCCRFNNWTKNLHIINAILLSEVASN
jgi:hypothetical protein